jgi:hypothetical protein
LSSLLTFYVMFEAIYIIQNINLNMKNYKLYFNFLY